MQQTDLIKRMQDDLTAAKARADYLSTAFPSSAQAVRATNKVAALRRMLQTVTSKAAKNT
jgi:hypothetical protein